MKNEHSQSEAEKQDFITILKTGDQVKISMAKAILDAENIVYLVKNEIVQDLFGLGKVGGYNYLLDPTEEENTKFYKTIFLTERTKLTEKSQNK